MKARVLTAIPLILIVLACVISVSSIPLALLILFCALAGYRELAVLVFGKESKGPTTLSAMLSLAVLLVFLPLGALNSIVGPFLYGFALCLTGIYCCLKINLRSPYWGIVMNYLVGPFICLLSIHALNLPPDLRTSKLWDFHNPLLLFLLPLWAGDTAAIFGGMFFGKHKLAPNLSPGKTWEGAILNFAACVLVAWLLSYWILVPVWVGLATGMLIGICGQVGDLFESKLKRNAGVKNSGSLLPGHGGLLDRIDSLLAVGAIAWVPLVLWIFQTR